MLLYAKVASERASKGQGGNDFLLVDVLDEKKNTLLRLRILPADEHQEFPIISIEEAPEFVVRQLIGDIESEENICDICGGIAQSGSCCLHCIQF